MKGIVVAAHPIAAEAGAQVLREGGNAIDAAIAVSLTIGVVEPFASGLGGGGFMMICPKGDLARTVILDSRARVPSMLTRERVYSRGRPMPWTPHSGPMAAAVPGLGRTLEWAMRDASLPLKRLAQPAIEAAAGGFEVSETFRHCNQMFEGTMRVDAELCSIFMKDGRVMKPGDRLVQKDLAATLEHIVSEGFETLFTGAPARAMLDTMNRTGPLWGERDLADYELRERPPLRASVNGFDLLVTPPPSRGGAGVVQVAQSFFAAGAPARDSAALIEFYGRTLPAVFAALDPLIGDPEENPVPPEKLLDPALLGPAGTPVLKDESASTTHFAIVDPEGTIVTSSQTLGHFYGSGVVARGTGIVLNGDLTDMSILPDHPNSIHAGRRSVANMNPMIIAKGGRPLFALGTPGSRRITAALAQTTLNLIGYDLGLEAAVAAPRMHWEAGALHVEGGFDPGEMKRARPECKVIPHGPNDLYFGGVHAAAVLPDGTVTGVADPRRDGVAVEL